MRSLGLCFPFLLAAVFIFDAAERAQSPQIRASRRRRHKQYAAQKPGAVTISLYAAPSRWLFSRLQSARGSHSDSAERS